MIDLVIMPKAVPSIPAESGNWRVQPQKCMFLRETLGWGTSLKSHPLGHSQREGQLRFVDEADDRRATS
jgi:hypothetical protein